MPTALIVTISIVAILLTYVAIVAIIDIYKKKKPDSRIVVEIIKYLKDTPNLSPKSKDEFELFISYAIILKRNRNRNIGLFIEETEKSLTQKDSYLLENAMEKYYNNISLANLVV